jgi:NET1-associated nuclear protein 1 (U3 small nucleolar RNA-associated protein 17)
LSGTEDGHQGRGSILSTALSKSAPDYIWVTCTDGRIYNINWTTGTGALDAVASLPPKTTVTVSVQLMQIDEESQDILFVLEQVIKEKKRTDARLVAYNRKALATGEGVALHNCGRDSQMLQVSVDGRVAVITDKETIHIGVLDAKEGVKSLADLRYRFHSFDTKSVITCLDIRLPPRSRRQEKDNRIMVDLVVGCAEGAIQVYRDLVSKLPRQGSDASKGQIRPKVLHWHRRSIHSLKWSQDGKREG